MKRTQPLLGLLTFGILLGSCLAVGQEIRTVENPHQGEYPYRVDSVLRPQVMIDGLRWGMIKIEPKEGRERISGKNVPTNLILELENGGESTADVLAVFLLEDERGNQLARLESKKIRIRSGRLMEVTTKLKVDGGALNKTHKIWAYVEVTR